MSIGGGLTVTNLAGDDEVRIGGLGTVDLHNVTINQGNGNGTITFEGLSATITGNLQVTNAEGADILNVAGLDTFTVTGGLTINKGMATQRPISSTTVASVVGGACRSPAVSASMKSALLALFSTCITQRSTTAPAALRPCGAARPKITGNLSFTGEVGFDTFHVIGSKFAVSGNLSLTGTAAARVLR